MRCWLCLSLALAFHGCRDGSAFLYQPKTRSKQAEPKYLSAASSQRNTHNDTQDFDNKVSSLSRRGIVNSFGRTAAVFSTGMLELLFRNINVANAAPPITVQEAESFEAKAQRLVRPKPPKILRPKLEKDFAVLLMRASYNALDEIDCVAMDQFQRDFFIIRQAEYEPYVNLLGPGLVQQGDLTDPYYFDFISFAQYCAINREISLNPPYVFTEQQSVDVGEDEPQQFVARVIKRDPASLPNSKLGEVHSTRVGRSILDRLEKTFGETPIAIPKISPNSKPSKETLLSSMSQLVKLFLINGFAFDGNVSIVSNGSTGIRGDASGTEFRITLNSPATIWSGQALRFRRAGVSNNFLLKTATELVRKSGYDIASTTVKYDGSKELCSFTIR